MIRIARGAAPKVLLTAGTAARTMVCAQVEQDGEHQRLRFDDGIYGHASVTETLAAMQYGKCCYCEGRVDRGTVDHYRPKGAIYQAPRERVSARGYYWLAYTWDNLLLACNDCNTRFKRELFPLEDPARRVLSHQAADQIGGERPLLLDPTRDDPEEHVTFRGFTPVARTRRGRETINLLHLDRPFLENDREERLRQFKVLLIILDAARAGRDVSELLLRETCELVVHFTAAPSPYLGMIRSVLKNHMGEDFMPAPTVEGMLGWAARNVSDAGSSDTDDNG